MARYVLPPVQPGAVHLVAVRRTNVSYGDWAAGWKAECQLSGCGWQQGTGTEAAAARAADAHRSDPTPKGPPPVTASQQRDAAAAVDLYAWADSDYRTEVRTMAQRLRNLAETVEAFATPVEPDEACATPRYSFTVAQVLGALAGVPSPAYVQRLVAIAATADAAEAEAEAAARRLAHAVDAGDGDPPTAGG